MLSPAAVRERVFVEIERLRPVVEAALARGGSNRFSWLDCELWIDRTRWIVLDEKWAREKLNATADRVPDEHQDRLRLWSSRDCGTDSWNLVELLAAFIRGNGSQRGHGGLCSIFINYAVVQPLVNPAFRSLFWLALNEDLDRRHSPAADLGAVVGAMAYDMSLYPASKSEAPQVRAAQVEFVKAKLDRELPDGKWRHAEEDAWAKHCADLWHADKGENLFGLVLEQVQFPD